MRREGSSIRDHDQRVGPRGGLQSAPSPSPACKTNGLNRSSCSSTTSTCQLPTRACCIPCNCYLGEVVVSCVSRMRHRELAPMVQCLHLQSCCAHSQPDRVGQEYLEHRLWRVPPTSLHALAAPCVMLDGHHRMQRVSVDQL